LIAVALIDGTFGLAQFENERWNDPKVRALMARLQMTTDPDLARRAGEASPCALNTVDRGGRSHDVEILAPPGFSARGPVAGTVLEKFSRITADRVAPAARERIIECVLGLDAAPSCNNLMQALAAPSNSAGLIRRPR
jgi:2-methylcitrate dehydratase PrpD